MTDIIFTLAVLFFTAAMIAAVRLFTQKRLPACPRPRARVTVWYGPGGECLEYGIGRIYESRAFADYDLEVEVVDTVATEESRRWLLELQRKLKREFIISEDKCERGAWDDDHNGDG